MTVRRVSVSVDDDHIDTIGVVAEALRHEGMQVEQVMDTLGIISGSVPEEAEPALRRVAGVVSVDESRDYQLPPPDSPVQ